MLVKIELTDYHIKWMQENYGKVSRKDCAQHFQVSLTTIDRWAKQLGLRKQQGSKVIREKRKVPVEVDGGVWTGGRHINPAGYINDMEKLNTAASMGWLVLRITTDDRFASKTYDLIKAAVEYRINES